MKINVDAALADAYTKNIGPFEELLKRYHTDPGYRSRLELNPIAEFRGGGIDMKIPEGIEVRVMANTADTFHVTMPPDPNVELSDEMLEMVAAGSTTGTVGSVGTFACSCAASTFGTAATAGTAAG